MEKTLSWVAVGVVGLAGLAFLAGCEKNESPPPPLPAPTAAPQATETLALVPDEEQPVDAGQDAAAPKGKGVAVKRASFKACCDALQQNAASAPEPTATYMKQAAATCSALVSAGQEQGTIMAAIRGALGGAALPGPCR
jgi:hypothetical protein